MPPQFIYVMKDLRKVVPPSREILRGIWLSFYPGTCAAALGEKGGNEHDIEKSTTGQRSVIPRA